MNYHLSQLEGCFEGLVPAKIATCSLAGIPNASYLSHVYYVDDRHIATSYQFFNKTRANLLENPFASIQVRHPSNMKPYVLTVKYLRSEDSGPIYHKMAVKLDVIAASEGMGEIFKLKAADIYEVLKVEEVAGKIKLAVDESASKENLDDLELIRVLSEKLNKAHDMEELFDLSMELLNRYLDCTHMMLLLADEDRKTLLTHATFGYAKGGVGSEVLWGQGLIGLCAQHRREFQISGLSQGLRYAQAVKKSLVTTSFESLIPLPGLNHPASQVTVPVFAHGELLGVLFVESETKPYWNKRDTLLLSTATNILGLGIISFEGKANTIRPALSDANTVVASTKEWRFRYVENDDVIFVNDQYLIKNIPAQILRYLLMTYLRTGRTEFSNMELRAEKTLVLPEVKDNLEARLILLRKRLEEQECGVRLVSTGRGRFKIKIGGKISV